MDTISTTLNNDGRRNGPLHNTTHGSECFPVVGDHTPYKSDTSGRLRQRAQPWELGDDDGPNDGPSSSVSLFNPTTQERIRRCPQRSFCESRGKRQGPEAQREREQEVEAG